MKYIPSPIFYMGSKYRLLKQPIPLFPKECDIFLDAFGGSGVVSMNYKGQKRTIYNEFNPMIYSLVKLFKDGNFSSIDKQIQQRIDAYNLVGGKARRYFKTEEEFLKDINAKKERYNKFRKDYNSNKKSILDLYILSIFSCNHLIRFNQNGEFNTSFGCGCVYNDTLKNKIKNGINSMGGLELSNNDFFNLDLDFLTSGSFIYLDPPYSNTNASYNEKGKFSQDWSIEKDFKLFSVLEELDKKGIKWGLSNVFENRGIKNEHLIEWCEKNNYSAIHLKSNYSPFSRGGSNSDEVYICNYEVKIDEIKNNETNK